MKDKIEIKNGYRLVFRLSKPVELKPFSGSINPDEFAAEADVLEERFFDSGCEFRAFKYNDEMRYSLIRDKGEDLEVCIQGKAEPDLYEKHSEGFETISESGEIKTAPYKKRSAKLSIKKYVFFDSDGQAYVKITRLCGIEV